MKLIIDTPDEEYKTLSKMSEKEKINELSFYERIIANGIPYEEKQGKWGKHGECPFCSYIRQWEDDKFCGNCGAKMQKGDIEE